VILLFFMKKIWLNTWKSWALILGFFGSLNAQEFKTHYQVFGKGTPILLINGGPGLDSRGFEDIARAIADLGYQTIIYDQRGTGKSTLPALEADHISLDFMSQDIEDLRKELGFSSWVIFGQSFGGMLATHYTAQHPQIVQKLILSSSGGVNMKFAQYFGQQLMANLTPVERDSLQYWEQKLHDGDESDNAIWQHARLRASAFLVNKSYVPTLAQRLTQNNTRVNSLVINDMIKNKFNYYRRMNDFKAPVLVFQGKNDVIRVETAQEIKETFPKAELVVLDRCGHYPWIDQPEVFFEKLRAFLKG
jgi:proline iminopeptidase